MTQVFLQIINMSISASYIVLAVLLLRFVLKKAPKWVAVLLWGIVAVRLICPFSLESVLSLIPSAQVVSPGIMTDNTPSINTGIPVVNNTLNPVIGSSFVPAPGESVNPLQIWIPVLAALWLVGVATMLLYMVVSYLRVKRKIGMAVVLRDNIYQSENVVSPFVLGIVKPKIYLPFRMGEQDMAHVVAHEQAHLRRKDHLWKPLGFLLLAFHWFNPLMWVAYVLLCRDIELACDEKVIKELDHDARADYSQALLACSVNRRMIAACPLAFGEVGVKDRVKSVLNYKKPAFWVIVAAVLVCVAVAVCFLTNPESKVPNYGESDPTNLTPTQIFLLGEYPEYFGLDASEGLDVYVWQMAAGSYSFGLLPHADPPREWLDDEVMSLRGLRTDQMRAVLSTYSVAEEDVHIIPWQNPLSSYIGEYWIVEDGEDTAAKRKAYVETIREMLFGEVSRLDEASLRKRYPEYFALNASDGLDVYAHETPSGDYTFWLCAHTEMPYSDFDLWRMEKGPQLSAAEMRIVLSSYDVDPEKVSVILWHSPVLSYIPSWRVGKPGESYEQTVAPYIKALRGMLLGEGTQGEQGSTGNAGTSDASLIYSAPALIYSAPALSWVTSYVPQVTIFASSLYDAGNGELLGVLRRTTMEQVAFDHLAESYNGQFAELVEELRQNNDIIYQVQPFLAKQNGVVDLYYVMLQKDGTTLLVYGHYENGEKMDYIRWIFNLGK